MFLGDLIDYGMHSNEVIEMIQSLKYPLICNLRGNHEQAIITESYDRFSSKRGRACAMYTHSVLNENTWNYMKNIQNPSGMSEFMLEEKRCLDVHGSLEDNYCNSPGRIHRNMETTTMSFPGIPISPIILRCSIRRIIPRCGIRKRRFLLIRGLWDSPGI